MKNNFFSSFRGLHNQLNTKNDFLIFKYNDNFFSIKKSERHIKYEKHILDIFGFLAVVIYFSFIRRTLLDNVIYIRIIVFIGLVGISLEIGTISKTLFNYIYCKKQMKENNATLLKNQDVIKDFF